jgi:hypothetical protein
MLSATIHSTVTVFTTMTSMIMKIFSLPFMKHLCGVVYQYER